MTARAFSVQRLQAIHGSTLREGDEIPVGKAVTFEIGVNPKWGKSKAASVDWRTELTKKAAGIVALRLAGFENLWL